ncbi:DUF4157 domain-containing protein [Fulvivirga sp. 29W222]|uniref:DUF4157 domain-containing protein n=1 Tax=Fulvivirga marina TaxID=2494733 RepID=A0A937G479_9BACT|nr:DUF4157 domain-containing protein [Fulvivirga marina]MBL6448136.1 DUF4157 domain-containing protein [Fulvivirga marina]
MKDNISASSHNTGTYSNNLNQSKNSLSGSNLDRNTNFTDNLSKGNLQNITTQLKKEGTSGPKSSQTPNSNKTGLPDNLKAGIENLSGYSMDDVKVHYNSPKPAQLNAHAYAQGTDIHVAPGQEQHLPHEAWHTVQQKQGRVQPTMQMKGGMNVNDDTSLEREADVMGAKAIQTKAQNNTSIQKKKARNNTSLTTKQLSSTGTIQMAVNIDELDARYQHWLQYNETETFMAYVNSKMDVEYESLEGFLEAESTTKDQVQRLMRNFVGKSAIESTKQKIKSFGEGLHKRHSGKFKRSKDFTDKQKLRNVGVHAVRNTFDRELADLSNGTRLYHCTKAAAAIMAGEMRGGSGIRDGGRVFNLDPSLVGRTSFTTDPKRTMLGHDQLVMTLEAGDIERYGIFHFSRDEYVATRPIPGGRFSIVG